MKRVTFTLLGVIFFFFAAPAFALGTPQIVLIDPPSPQPVGTCIKVRAKVDWDADFRSMRMKFGPIGWEEEATPEFERVFCPIDLAPGEYEIKVQVARWRDNEWSNPTETSTKYILTPSIYEGVAECCNPGCPLYGSDYCKSSGETKSAGESLKNETQNTQGKLLPLIFSDCQLVQGREGRIYLVEDNAAHWIPNPETFDALGFRRDQIYNQGYTEEQIENLIRGNDIPDYTRDPGGFNAFVSSSKCILPTGGPEYPPCPGPVPDEFKPRGILNIGDECTQETEGGGSFSYLVLGGPNCIGDGTGSYVYFWSVKEDDGTIAGVPDNNTGKLLPVCKRGTNPVTPAQEPSQPNPPSQQESVPPTAVPQVEPTLVVEAPTESVEEPFFCNWPILGWLACDLAEANAVGASTNTVCNPQCVTEARNWRRDISIENRSLWASASTAQGILDIADKIPTFNYDGQLMQVRVRTATEASKNGDLVVWPSGCGGVTYAGGHIGIAISDQNGGYVNIHDSNSDNKCTQLNRKVKIEKCMRFITAPFAASSYQPPKTDKCSQYKWPKNWLCKLGFVQ